MIKTMFVDPSRCIGCRACEAACRECDSHKGESMIMVDFLDRSTSVATQPTLCMHCEDPVAPCAQSCPVMAILITPEGVVQQAEPSRCIACQNCVFACPFGVPKIDLDARLMKKCNLCYDRTAEGLKPWCAQACPTEAIWYGDYEEFAQSRRGRAVRYTVFGEQEVRTRVFHVLPEEAPKLEVTKLLAEARAETGAPAEGEEAWMPMSEKSLSVPVPGEPLEEGENPKRWRAQFPYHWDADDRVARRQLLQFCVYTSGALCLGTGALAVLGQVYVPKSDAVKELLPAADLAEGQAHYFRYPTADDQAMLLRLPGGKLVAFSQKCTHLSCAVFYQPEKARLFCPCHDGVFDPQTGGPVAGPPRRRLPQVLLREQDGMILAVGMVP